MSKVKPYEGDKPYIFISYAHKNKKDVFPIIERLTSNGYRVWYDEGIELGSEWDENIALHINKAHCMVSMISKEYVESKNCKDELKYARNKDKEQFLIYLVPTTLPDGLQMRLDSLQAAYKYAYPDENDFYDKLYSTEILSACKGDKPVGGEDEEVKKVKVAPQPQASQVFDVRFSWPAGFAWCLRGSIMITVDNASLPYEITNGGTLTVKLLKGVHYFSFCAKGFRVGQNLSITLDKNIGFVCKPSSDAIAWGYLTNKPSVSVTMDPSVQ